MLRELLAHNFSAHEIAVVQQRIPTALLESLLKYLEVEPGNALKSDEKFEDMLTQISACWEDAIVSFLKFSVSQSDKQIVAAAVSRNAILQVRNHFSGPNLRNTSPTD